MDTQRRWIPYDTFKLIVGVVLLLLILFLALQSPAVSPPVSAGQETSVGVAASTQTPLSPTNTAPSPSTRTASLPTATLTAQPSSTPTATLPPPTPSPTSEPPTAAPTSEAQAEATATPEPEAQAAPTATLQPQSGAADCPLAQPSRLAVGRQALVTARLNLRADAGMDNPILRVLLPDSSVEVVGGPVCTPYQNGAYLWWNVQAQDGQTGWSAEASVSSSFYFLQPVP